MCKKYNLLGVIKNAIEGNVLVNVNEWKRTVKAHIWNVQNERMNIVCSVNKTLSLFEIPVRSNAILAWWSLAHQRPDLFKRCRIIVRLLLDCHKLKCCRVRYHEPDVVDSICELCTLHCSETVAHILFECPGNVDRREVLWNEIAKECPEKLLKEMGCMNSVKKTSFLLTGLNNTFIVEWTSLFEKIVQFIYNVYKERL